VAEDRREHPLLGEGARRATPRHGDGPRARRPAGAQFLDDRRLLARAERQRGDEHRRVARLTGAGVDDQGALEVGEGNADVTTLAEVTGRTILPEQNHNDPAIATAGSAAVVPSPDAQALEMIRDEWLRPLIAEIGDLREELGKVKAERDAALERLGASNEALPASETTAPPVPSQRESAASWHVRLRRWMGWE